MQHYFAILDEKLKQYQTRERSRERNAEKIKRKEKRKMYVGIAANLEKRMYLTIDVLAFPLGVPTLISFSLGPSLTGR